MLAVSIMMLNLVCNICNSASILLEILQSCSNFQIMPVIGLRRTGTLSFLVAFSKRSTLKEKSLLHFGRSLSDELHHPGTQK